MTIEAARPPAGSHSDHPVDSSPGGGAPLRWNLIVLLLLAAGYALTILVFQPGYPTLDARYLYNDAMAWNFPDWQSPVMGLLWWLIDPLAPGAMSMFLLIASLYWLGFGLLAFTVARQARWLGIVTPLLALVTAGILLRRHDLARHPVRRGLAGRGRVAVRGGRTRARACACRCRSLRCCSSRSAFCCGRTRSSPRRSWRSMCCGRRASTSGARRSGFCRLSSSATRLCRRSITG